MHTSAWKKIEFRLRKLGGTGKASLKQSLGSNDISSLWQTNRFVKNDCAQGTVAAILEHGRASDSSTDRTIGVAEHTDMIRINMAM